MSPSTSSSSPPRLSPKASSTNNIKRSNNSRNTSSRSIKNKPTLEMVQEISKDFKFYNHESTDGKDISDVEDYFTHDRYLSGASSKQLRLELYNCPTTASSSSSSSTSSSQHQQQQQAQPFSENNNALNNNSDPNSNTTVPATATNSSKTATCSSSNFAENQKLFVKICDNPLSEDEKSVLREMRRDTIYSPGTFQEDEDALSKDELVVRWSVEVTEHTTVKKIVIPCENGVDRYGLILDKKVMFRFDSKEECSAIEKEVKSFVSYRKPKKLVKKADEVLMAETSSSSSNARKSKVAKKSTEKKVSVGKKK